MKMRVKKNANSTYAGMQGESMSHEERQKAFEQWALRKTDKAYLVLNRTTPPQPKPDEATLDKITIRAEERP